MESREGPDITEVRVLVQFCKFHFKNEFFTKFLNDSAWFCVEKLKKQGYETNKP